MNFTKLLILITLLFFALLSFAENGAKDSIKIKGPNSFFLGKKLINTLNDTTIFLPDSLEFIFQKQNKPLFKRKDANKSRNQISNQIQSWLFSGRPDTSNNNLNRIHALNKFSGKYVRNIKINSVNVFGPSLTDNTPDTTLRWIERAGNSIHKNTSKTLIYKTLNINKGDKLSDFELSEKEVIIRNLPYISDILINPVKVPNTDSVDLNIFVQDVWSIGFHLEPYDTYKGYFEVFDENTAGQGQETLLRLRYNTKNSPAVGYELSYTLFNLGKEIIKTKIGYSNYFNYRDFIFNMQKDYYYGSNYAFGILSEVNTSMLHFAYINKDVRIKSTINDLWIGKGYPLVKSDDQDIKISKIYFALRFGSHIYNGERLISPTINSSLVQKKVYLSSIALSKQRYNQTKLLLGYGRTEDIPIGYKAEFVSGASFDEFRNRPYFAFKTAGGDIFKMGYLSAYLNIGGFLYKDSIQQGVFNTGFFYYSNLMLWGLYRFRQFVGVDYTSGFNRFDGYGERLFLQNTNGIRGYTSDSAGATRRAYLRLETVCYSPHTHWGFKTAYYIYSDFAWLSNKSSNILNGPLYYGIGAGIRIRNERLAFKTVTLRLAFYPNVPIGGRYSLLEITGLERLSLNGFKPGQPDFVSYQ